MKNVKSPGTASCTPNWTPDRKAALRLASAWELGSKTLGRIREQGLGFSDFLEEPDLWKELGLNAGQRAALTTAVRADLDPLMAKLEKSGITFLLPEDDAFPRSLLKQADAPFALFTRGSPLAGPDAREELRVAVVGTRRMTDYGRSSAKLLVEELVHHDVTIVSGLAFGIDSAAHAACLEANGKTIAVLPGGVDDASIAPREHAPLVRRILAAGGTLLSEHAPNMPVHPFHFLHRNRLIAALADAVLVIEADRDSGSLTTARLAIDCGREVLAVPGSIWSPVSRGTNDLIKSGATPCTSADDVFAALGLNDPERKRALRAKATATATPEERRILDALAEPHSVDDLARELNQPVAPLTAAISLLELKGRVLSVGPRLFVRAP